MKDIIPILRSLGLADTEIRTYMIALNNGPQPVIVLSKLLKISRQATYNAIDGLIDRGLMTTVQSDKRTLYMAEHPQKLIAYAERKQDEIHQQINDLRSCLPSLELQIGGEKPIVKMYEGREGVHAMIEDLRQERPKTFAEITDHLAMMSVMTDEDLAPFRKVLFANNPVAKSIIAGPVRPAPKGVPGTRRVLPREDWGFKSHIHVAGNQISMVTFPGKMQCIVIKNKYLANTMRILFKLARLSLPGPDL